VTVEGRLVTLTAKEFDLLAFLAQAPRQVFSRAQLLQHVWDSSPDYQDPATSPCTSGVSATRSRPTQNRSLDHHGVGRRLQVRAMNWRLIGGSPPWCWVPRLLPRCCWRHRTPTSAGTSSPSSRRRPCHRGHGAVLRRWVSSRASVAGAALVVGLCSLALGAVTTSAASNAMFLSSHDYRLFLVVLVLSCGIALVVGSQLTRPLARDIARLGQVAEQVAAGDLTVRTGVRRKDEVGRTAVAVDAMVQSLQAAADERERLAAARQMLFTGIGHDLRTPLAAMRAAVESLQDGIAPDPDRYLGLVGNELSNVEALLDQLVEFARIESGQRTLARESVSVAELAHEAIEALAPVADRRAVQLGLRQSGPALITANSLDISRVMRNLVENAIRHAPSRAPYG
jgi:HAMP domain-containing protein